MKKKTRGANRKPVSMDLSTECIRAFWKKGDQQDMNDEEIVLALIKVQVTQEKTYFSAEEMSKDDVEYTG